MAFTGMHFGPLCSIQWIVGPHGARLDRDPHDDLILDDETGHALLHGCGLHPEEAEQDRYETEDRTRNH